MAVMSASWAGRDVDEDVACVANPARVIAGGAEVTALKDALRATNEYVEAMRTLRPAVERMCDAGHRLGMLSDALHEMLDSPGLGSPLSVAWVLGGAVGRDERV
jgi:hypothetical protein